MSIYVLNVLTKVHENPGPVTCFLTCCKHVSISSKCKIFNNYVAVLDILGIDYILNDHDSMIIESN